MDSIRSVLRGEAAGSVKFVAVSLIMLIIWAGVWTVSDWNAQAQTALTSQQGRWRTLLLLGDEYKSIAPSSTAMQNQNVDVAAVFAQVSENMELGKPSEPYNARRPKSVS